MGKKYLPVILTSHGYCPAFLTPWTSPCDEINDKFKEQNTLTSKVLKYSLKHPNNPFEFNGSTHGVKNKHAIE